MGKGGCATPTVAKAAQTPPPPPHHHHPSSSQSKGAVVAKKSSPTTPTPTNKISPTLLATKTTPAECWLVHNSVVYDVTSWLAKHPGGTRTILSNSGRDCTAVLLAMHDPKTLERSLRRVRKVGAYDPPDLPADDAVAGASGGSDAAAVAAPDAEASDAAAPDERTPGSGREEEEEEEKKEETTTTTTTAPPTSASAAAQQPAASTRKEAAATTTTTTTTSRRAAMECDFRTLDDMLVREGWYVPSPSRYWIAVLRAVGVLAGGVGLALWGGGGGVGGGGDAIIHAAALLVGSILIGLFFQQTAFFGHDAGHGSITGSFRSDSMLGLIVGNALAGIDISWWKSTHNVHHGATNSLRDDPDIQHLPIFCFEEDMVRERTATKSMKEEKKDGPDGRGESESGSDEGMWSTYHGRYMVAPTLARRLMAYQHYYFYPVMAFARVNLYVQSILHLARICPFFGGGGAQGSGGGGSGKEGSSAAATDEGTKSKQQQQPYDWPTATPQMWVAQVASLSIFYVAWYALLTHLDGPISAGVCFGLSHVVAGVLHVQILLSHIAMEYHLHDCTAGVGGGGGGGGVGQPTDGSVGGGNSPDVGFHELQALTTMDISCPPALDWVHGGLQFQLEHHLFPRLPKFQLRRLIPFVDAIFAKHGVTVVRKGFVEANWMVLGHMARVGRSISRVKGD